MSALHRQDPELYALAGEYVLGTLPADERRRLELRLAQDEPLRAAVTEWEERLHPLTGLVALQTPSPRLWPRVERSLDALSRTRTAAGPVRWWQRLGLWRGLTAASLAMTLLLAAVLLYRPLPEPRYVVVLVAPDDRAPGWLIQASDPREIQLVPLGTTEVPADMALEFWTKADDWSRPVSLGLVEPGKTLRIPLDALPPLESNQLFELTLEQASGSPTGLPTGPIQFIGRAVKI
ncbi:RNA polymerase subunit sigma-70 [Zobellella endophytica]|uniref:Regulator of SigK n=1 Tax=Zobellella endophytica TaxID=2116700 RepID=A0A2P7RBU7_9GAMM|nr:anti-sigma factor [Zobellella endophytica]PSJ47679.1 RNA polymerase subunit sigma-70 [Zobellella endophytica]